MGKREKPSRRDEAREAAINASAMLVVAQVTGYARNRRFGGMQLAIGKFLRYTGTPRLVQDLLAALRLAPSPNTSRLAERAAAGERARSNLEARCFAGWPGCVGGLSCCLRGFAGPPQVPACGPARPLLAPNLHRMPAPPPRPPSQLTVEALLMFCRFDNMSWLLTVLMKHADQPFIYSPNTTVMAKIPKLTDEAAATLPVGCGAALRAQQRRRACRDGRQIGDGWQTCPAPCRSRPLLAPASLRGGAASTPMRSRATATCTRQWTGWWRSRARTWPLAPSAC